MPKTPETMANWLAELPKDEQAAGARVPMQATIMARRVQLGAFAITHME